MKNSRVNVLGTAIISAIAIGTLGFMGGCKSQEILKDRPYVPAPSNQEPANPPAPAVVAPVVVQPVLPPPPPPVIVPAPAVVKPAPVKEETVPK